jgi:hypothetical protein
MQPAALQRGGLKALDQIGGRVGTPGGCHISGHVRPELDLWVALTPGGCQIGYMCDQNSTYGLHSLPGVVRLVTWTILAFTWTILAAIN